MPVTSATASEHSAGQPADQASTRAQWREMAAGTPGTLLFECTANDACVDPAEGATLLFRDPQATLTASKAEELPGLLAALESALARGLHVAGYLTYEAACMLEGARPAAVASGPLAWFGIYAAPERLDAPGFATPMTPQSHADLPLCFDLETERAAYLERVARAQRYIASGDSYQVNLTTAVTSRFRGDVPSLYGALSREQPTAFSALLHPEAGRHVLSFSPELLFRVTTDGQVIARPMKGTAAPGNGETGDGAAWLQKDEKNRAEHVMIVDLLRNDLNRVATAGSVRVDAMFAVERYDTVLQMTSTVRGELRPGVKLGDLLRALLPAGSMTGAPKHRTIEILADLEEQPRGVYSGAIGFAAPDGTAVFSVPIRTVTLEDTHLRMGVGGGIVADSRAEEELAECWLKCAFLHRAAVPFDLVETFRWDGVTAQTADARSAYAALACGNADDHLDRLAISADRLGFRFVGSKIRDALAALALSLPEPRRIRMLLDRGGEVRFEVSPLDLWPDFVAMRVSPERVWSGDPFLHHKTSHRPIYNRELADARRDGFADALFLNERGELAEGAISSVLLLLDGDWVTPSLSTGLLPGVARARLLRTGQVTERLVMAADLHRASAIVAANGVRGAAQVMRLQLHSGDELRFAALATIPAS